MSRRPSVDERLPAATRSYVIFGLVFVIALGLGLRSWLSPSQARGESDNWLRLLVVGSSGDWPAIVGERDGLVCSQRTPLEVIDGGRAILGGDDPEAHTPLAAALAYADQHGYGFIAFVREDAEAYGIDPDPPADPEHAEQATFFVYSVGDVADEGPQVHWGPTAAAVGYDMGVRELDSLRRATFEHPDMQALWQREGSAALQARQILDSRKVRERSANLAADHERWAELDAMWPDAATLPGSLAAPWEQVRAAPVQGGVLVERRGVRAYVDAYRRLRLEVDARGELWFVPAQAIREGEDLVAARQRCEGLPDSVAGEVVVAPDGGALLLQETLDGPAEVSALTPKVDGDGRPQCSARSLGVLNIDGPLGRPDHRGRVAWNRNDDWLHWWDRGGEHRLQVFAIDAYSGPWWIDDGVLAMIAERPRPAPDFGNDRVLALVLTDTPDSAAADP
ncbi:MAG: hypothetical protein KC457_22210, partial [Myxococcales bacterium]|nr:hypothetical protein [Myxococcales bacterium]